MLLEIPSFVCSMSRRPPMPTLFPYTTLFRSSGARVPGDAFDCGCDGTRLSDGAGRCGNAEYERCADDAPPHDACLDRKSTRLNSSHLVISYAVFCLKKKTNNRRHMNP